VLGVSIVLFVVLLAVLFAVAAVTAGFGDLMQPVFQDARPVGLPEQSVGPNDLDALKFNVVLRGYKMAEVDAVLHRLSRELAERDAVLHELRGGTPSRSFRPEPPERAPYEDAHLGDQRTELMAPYVDPDVDTDEQPAVGTYEPDAYRTVRHEDPTEAFPALETPPEPPASSA
jgi:DivIVA domain-containing protein